MKWCDGMVREASGTKRNCANCERDIRTDLRMSPVDSGDADDPWLTVAEVAAELRLNPATIRLWISKGQLTAVRRSSQASDPPL
jgi:hypothetical protein